MFISFLAWDFFAWLYLQCAEDLNIIIGKDQNVLLQSLVYPGVEVGQAGEGQDAGAHQAEYVHVVPEDKA